MINVRRIVNLQVINFWNVHFHLRDITPRTSKKLVFTQGAVIVIVFYINDKFFLPLSRLSTSADRLNLKVIGLVSFLKRPMQTCNEVHTE